MEVSFVEQIYKQVTQTP